MTDEQHRTSIQDEYAQRLAADLESNRQEQKDILAKTAEMQARLTQLQQDEAWLAGMQEALPGRTAAPSNVPKPRRMRESGSEPAAAAKPVEGKKESAKTSAQPTTLREIVFDRLARHGEPRVASEVAADLAAAHPERAASAQVVRNTLEALVAKGEIERDRKQRSVMYTAPQADTMPTRAKTPETGTGTGTGTGAKAKAATGKKAPAGA